MASGTARRLPGTIARKVRRFITGPPSVFPVPPRAAPGSPHRASAGPRPSAVGSPQPDTGTSTPPAGARPMARRTPYVQSARADSARTWGRGEEAGEGTGYWQGIMRPGEGYTLAPPLGTGPRTRAIFCPSEITIVGASLGMAPGGDLPLARSGGGARGRRCRLPDIRPARPFRGVRAVGGAARVCCES